VFESLEGLVPGISNACELYPSTNGSALQRHSGAGKAAAGQHFDWVNKVVFRTVDPLSTSSRGLDYSGLGCFPLGFHASQSEFDTVVRSQTHLLKLNLLKPIPKDELVSIAHQLQILIDSGVLATNWPSTVHERDLIQQLADSIRSENADETKDEQSVEIYIGLKTGFRANADCNSQFWGVFDGNGDVTRMYIQRDAKDLAGTILHTYLSSKRCERSKCFQAEYALATVLGTIHDTAPLPERMLQDIEMLTPTETLVFLQAIAISGSADELLAKIKQRCEHELIDVSSFAQLKGSSTIEWLRGDITVEELILRRLQWYKDQNVQLIPQLEPAVRFFETVDRVIDNILRGSLRLQANSLLSTLTKVLQPGKIDVRADLFSLAIFCSFRRYAYEEVYLEATDRCPVFSDQPDQTVVFAELWALGSHCEAYLDLTPKALGKILFDKYRNYYDKHQPPLTADGPTNFATAYPSAKTDIDREGITDLNKGFESKLRGTAYLGVFAVPALIDILLLTTIGRGLYLSAYMSEIEQQMSTNALVIALVLCGAVSSWTFAGGSYYLWAMVYPTMNMFMLTRLIGGIAFTSIVGAVSFIIVGILKGPYAAMIFILYLMVLSTYLFLLACMANMQFTGSPLPSVCPHSFNANTLVRVELQSHNVCVYSSYLQSSQHTFATMISSSISAFSQGFVSYSFSALDK
jgi:hypothetical protein